MRKKLSLLGICLIMASPFVLAHQHKNEASNEVYQQHDAHMHGVAYMNLLAEEQHVDIHLHSALASFISFEHTPETQAQKNEVEDMLAVFRQAEQHFVFPAVAQCRLNRIEFESEVIGDELLFAESQRSHENHTHAHDANGHEKVNAHGHLEIDMTFVCAHPDRLNSVTVHLFEAFPALREIEVQMVTPIGQRAQELSPPSNVIRW